MFNKKNKFSIVIAVALSTLFVACDDNNQTTPLEPESAFRAIVVNEGQFGAGTASLTGILKSGEVEENIFQRVNNRPIGDVAQSMARIGSNLYVPLNNSNKLEIFDAVTLQSVETISIDRNVIPMYVQHLGGDSIAVSDQMYTGTSQLMIIDINHSDPNRQKVRRYINMEGSCFQMQLTAGKLFVAGDKLAVFDVTAINETQKRYIKTPTGADIAVAWYSKLAIDKSGMMWVLTGSSLYRINPQTESVISTVDISGLNVNAWGASLDISPDGKTIYFNAETLVYAVDVDNIQTPTNPIVTATIESGHTIYHMCVSKENTIFMCDVMYGSLAGASIYEFDHTTGAKLKQFNVGLFPRFIYFM